MIPKRVVRAIVRAVERMRWRFPTAMLLLGMATSASAAESIDPINPIEPTESVEEFIPTEVEAEVNEDSLRYLLLEDYFVTAERIPSKRMSTPANVVVVTAAEIEANHYQSVEEALSHVNGMVLTFVNGSDRILMLVDGRRTMMEPPMKMIDRIEIVKGGGSALYGSDAVGGVINIITRRGDHDETTVDLNTGSWHRHRYEITNQGNDGRLGWFIVGSLGKNRPYDAKGSNNRTGDYDDKNFALRLDHRFDDRNSLTFDFMHRSNAFNKYRDDADAWSFASDYAAKHELINQTSLTYNFKEGTSTASLKTVGSSVNTS